MAPHEGGRGIFDRSMLFAYTHLSYMARESRDSFDRAGVLVSSGDSDLPGNRYAMAALTQWPSVPNLCTSASVVEPTSVGSPALSGAKSGGIEVK